MRFYYKSEDPSVVDTVKRAEAEIAALLAQVRELERILGRRVKIQRDAASFYVRGIDADCERSHLKPHWRLDGELRGAPLTPKDDKELRDALRKEHTRLAEIWKRHAPERVDRLKAWKALGVNTGNVCFLGGVYFSNGKTAYFELGFQCEIAGAVEIPGGEYKAAQEVAMAR